MTRDQKTIHIFALRYSFGRMTYAFSIVADEIMQHVDEFETIELEQMIDETERAELMFGYSENLISWTEENAEDIKRFKKKLTEAIKRKTEGWYKSDKD